MKKSLPNALDGSHRTWAREIFEWFVVRMMRKDFSDVILWGNRPPLPRGLPVIFVSNHMSWWDGFFLWRLQRFLMPGRPVYTVMLAREFYRSFWFKWVGMLPIDPASPGSLKVLFRRLAALAGDAPNRHIICSFFPQGVIKPSFARPLGFAEGLRKVADSMAPVVILPVGMHIEPLCKRRPQAFLTVGQPIIHKDGRLDIADVEQQVIRLLDNLLQGLGTHGEQFLERQVDGHRACASLV